MFTCLYTLWPNYLFRIGRTHRDAWILLFRHGQKTIPLVDGTKELSKHTVKHKRNEYQGYSSTPPHAEFHSNVYVLSVH